MGVFLEKLTQEIKVINENYHYDAFAKSIEPEIPMTETGLMDEIEGVIAEDGISAREALFSAEEMALLEEATEEEEECEDEANEEEKEEPKGE